MQVFLAKSRLTSSHLTHEFHELQDLVRILVRHWCGFWGRLFLQVNESRRECPLPLERGGVRETQTESTDAKIGDHDVCAVALAVEAEWCLKA
jgi:hypothetical protein